MVLRLIDVRLRGVIVSRTVDRIAGARKTACMHSAAESPFQSAQNLSCSRRSIPARDERRKTLCTHEVPAEIWIFMSADLKNFR